MSASGSFGTLRGGYLEQDEKRRMSDFRLAINIPAGGIRGRAETGGRA